MLNRLQQSTAGEVHGDFETDTQVDICGFGPGHGNTPLVGLLSLDGTGETYTYSPPPFGDVQMLRRLCY